MSALEHEATDTPNTVEHFGRKWELPSSLRLQDYERLNAVVAAQPVRHWDIALAKAFLSAEDYAALGEINPTNDELDEFGTKIGKALGFGGSGNS